MKGSVFVRRDVQQLPFGRKEYPGEDIVKANALKREENARGEGGGGVARVRLTGKASRYHRSSTSTGVRYCRKRPSGLLHFRRNAPTVMFSDWNIPQASWRTPGVSCPSFLAFPLNGPHGDRIVRACVMHSWRIPNSNMQCPGGGIYSSFLE